MEGAGGAVISLGPLEKPIKMDDYVFCPHKKITSVTLIVICIQASIYSTVLRVFCCFRFDVPLDLFMLIFHLSYCTAIRSGYAPQKRFNLINYTYTLNV